MRAGKKPRPDATKVRRPPIWIVLTFESQELTKRNAAFMAAGCTSDYPSYNPHVTITHDAGELDLSKVKPYAGPLGFGPEIFEPVGGLVEKSGNPYHGAQGRFASADSGTTSTSKESFVASMNAGASRATLENHPYFKAAVAALGSVERLTFVGGLTPPIPAKSGCKTENSTSQVRRCVVTRQA